jgi:hypothetical protein
MRAVVMEAEDPLKLFHQRSQIVHDAIMDAVHDAACRSHEASLQERVEAQLHKVSDEVTEAARKLKEQIS